MNKQEFMAFSLPYRLKVEINLNMGTYIPILRPLSDLTKEIEHNGEKFVPIDLLRKDGYYIGEDWIIENFKDVENSSFGFIQKLLEWHFDAANLIEKGEAIDVNSLNENPYK